MTLQLRPTFSESWYRVVGLKPRLRTTAQISRQFYRGEKWYVVRDPAGNQYHRLSEAAYKFVGLLDGTRTVGEAWEHVGGQLADDAPTQPEVIQILSQLYAANLIETNISPDAKVLFRRAKKQRQKKWQQRMMNVVFPRIPLLDPDQMLKTWMPLARPILSKVGVLVWLAVVAVAVAMLLPNLGKFTEQTSALLNDGGMLWWLLLGLSFIVIKAIHEAGHAFACRRFGGECHEVGIMFLVLMPCPYVDASSAWGFPSKWQRIFVGAAGMIFELFVTAILVFVFLNTNPESWTNKLAFNGILIAGISTILFNANPLLRYDGYYILSDLLEIPNLQMKSREYTLGLVKRYIFRVKQTQPLPERSQRKWLVVYWITSGIYRMFIGVAIVLMVLYALPPQLKPVGMLLGAATIATFFVVPTFKLFKYLTVEPELHRKRGRAWAFTLGVTALVVYGVGMWQFPVYVRAEGIVEPIGKQALFIRTPGEVVSVPVRNGDHVQAGDLILQARNEELESQLVRKQSRIEEVQLQMSQAAFDDPAGEQQLAETLNYERRELALLQKRQEELTIRASIDGILVAPGIEDRQGQYVQRGDDLGRVQETGRLEVVAVIDERDQQLINEARQKLREYEELPVEVRMESDVETVLRALSLDIRPAATREMPSQALMMSGGGQVTPDMQAAQDGRPMAASNQLQMRVGLANELAYVPGQRAYVRIELEEAPLIAKWYRRGLQMISNSGG